MHVIADPWFYVVAVPAVLLFGVAKGGFGGGLGVLAVPLMAIVISPVQAAAIMLPILCIMDLFSLWAFRGKWVPGEIRVLVPASILGIGIGTLLFEFMSPAVIRLMLGIVALAFTADHFIGKSRGTGVARLFSRTAGAVAAAVAGFTSFIAHAGGPPINMYLLRRNLDRTRFVGTTVLFFAVVNYVKLIPYAWLDLFDTANLGTSLVLSPLAPVGVGIGYLLHQRVTDRFFFFVVSVLLTVVGLKLVYDGASELLVGA